MSGASEVPMFTGQLDDDFLYCNRCGEKVEEADAIAHARTRHQLEPGRRVQVRAFPPLRLCMSGHGVYALPVGDRR